MRYGSPSLSRREDVAGSELPVVPDALDDERLK
jgi:hypothetical protein